MKSKCKSLVFAAIGVLALLSGCGRESDRAVAPTSERSAQLSSPEIGGGREIEIGAVEEEVGTTRGLDSGLQWQIQHSGPLEPWMQAEFDAFRQSIDDLTSSDPAVAEAAFGQLMARDPEFYPAVVRALTAGADDATKALIEQSLQTYWDQYGGRDGRGPGGGGREVTIEVQGKVTTAPGSKITIETLAHDFPIDVSGKTFPINVAESAHQCQHRVATSRTTIRGIRVPISFTLPGYFPVTGIKIDIVLIIDITVILRYYDCTKEGVEQGDRELLPQWDRLSAVTPARF